MNSAKPMFDVFARTDKVIEGWYWAYRSNKLKRGKAVPLNFIGRDLVLFRTRSGQVRAMDAYCPHMGAHLACGKVEGEGIRCPFHYWKFDGEGACVDIPSEKKIPENTTLKTWPVAEQHGLIWIWNGETPHAEVPTVPELRGVETEAVLGNHFFKNCHPNIVMINAIDNQHFYSVHPMVRILTGDLIFKTKKEGINCMHFNNDGYVPTTNMLTRFMGRFYANKLTYDMSYHFGSTGTVTLGPDFLHLYLIFALKPTPDGKTDGQTIMLTKKRRGLHGWLINRLILMVTRIARYYFAQGDTEIFQNIKFNYKTPVSVDRPILQFIKHIESQPTTEWAEPASPVAEPALAKPPVAPTVSEPVYVQ